MFTIVENNLWVVENAVPNPVCDYVVSHSEHADGKGDPDWKYKPCGFNGLSNENYRNSWEVHMKNYDAQKMLWGMIKPFVPQTLQGRKIIGPHYKTFYILRYKPGQKFEIHRDGHSTNSKDEKSYLTAILYLNDCKEGGATRFFEEPQFGLNFVRSLNTTSGVFDSAPRKGRLVLMRHYMLHQAMPVVKGVKYAIRFNILYETLGTKGYYKGLSRPDLKGDLVDPRYTMGVPLGTDRPRVYYFLTSGRNLDKWKPGRLPGLNEDRCETCFEILDLDYDYYTCPGCGGPVYRTDSRKSTTPVLSFGNRTRENV